MKTAAVEKKLSDHTAHGDQKFFGRLPAIDFRDRRHLLRVPSKMPATGTRYYYTGPVLDQGQTSQCVAYSGTQMLVTGPVMNKPYKTPALLYAECQKVDEWPGEDYDGTSVRALFKVLQGAGYIESYQWAFNLESVVSHLLKVGPVIFGTNWYSSMFDVDRTGFMRIKPGSQNVGGHAYMVKGVNVAKKALRIVNSWGTGWGHGGFAWLSFDDAERLLNENGEAATAKELKFKTL